MTFWIGTNHVSNIWIDFLRLRFHIPRTVFLGKKWIFHTYLLKIFCFLGKKMAYLVTKSSKKMSQNPFQKQTLSTIPADFFPKGKNILRPSRYSTGSSIPQIPAVDQEPSHELTCTHRADARWSDGSGLISIGRLARMLQHPLRSRCWVWSYCIVFVFSVRDPQSVCICFLSNLISLESVPSPPWEATS